MLVLNDLEKYDEELLTTLFDVMNKIEIRKISINFRELLSIEDAKKLFKKIRNFKTQNTISNEVSFFLLCFYD